MIKSNTNELSSFKLFWVIPLKYTRPNGQLSGLWNGITCN